MVVRERAARDDAFRNGRKTKRPDVMRGRKAGERELLSYEEAGRRCGLDPEECRMAKRLGVTPEALLAHHASRRAEPWKAVTALWVRRTHEARFERERTEGSRRWLQVYRKRCKRHGQPEEAGRLHRLGLTVSETALALRNGVSSQELSAHLQDCESAALWLRRRYGAEGKVGGRNGRCLNADGEQ